MKNLDLHIVDAFTQELFKGNPAAVILLDSWLEDSLMQKIASENNLSETAFIVVEHATSLPNSNIKAEPYYGQDIHHIRWFSPLSEIDFCGHATLASAFVLFNQKTSLNQLTFFAKAIGHITVNKRSCEEESNTNNQLIEMTFPNCKPKKVNKIPEDLLLGLSIKPDDVYQNQQAYFAIYENVQSVHEVISNNEALKRLTPFDVVVTAAAVKLNKQETCIPKTNDVTNAYDFVSRYFWPANGGDEDPVTGSIHAGLAPFWAEKLNKNNLVAYQASNRGGVLFCQVDQSNIKISGYATLYLTGKIHL